MPDQNSAATNQPSVNPPQETPSGTPTTSGSPPASQTPTSTGSPPPTTPDASTAPPPPIVEERPADAVGSPSQDVPPLPDEAVGDADSPPPLDVPPIVTTPGGKPKKKIGRKVFATILGILFLVGGVGAGVILVQQRQEIREKAAISRACKTCSDNVCVDNPPPCIPDINECSSNRDCAAPSPSPKSSQPGDLCKANDGTCVPDNYTCQTTQSRFNDCGTGYKCGYNCSASRASPSPSPVGQCTRASLAFKDTNATSITITQEMVTACTNACPDAKLWVARYNCDEITPGGCQDNGTILSQDAKAGETFSASDPTCGKIQVDVGCKNAANTWGSVAFVSKSALTSCRAPSTPPPGMSARCLNIQAFDTSWNKITDLSTLKAGDVVRFTVAGTTTQGSIDKARFIINGSQRTAVTAKRPGTQEFYDEYTIPETVMQFTINAQLHHTDPSVGWF